jgi:hypothetical protein
MMRDLLMNGFCALITLSVSPIALHGQGNGFVDQMPTGLQFGSDSRFVGGVIPKPEFRPLTRFEGKGLGKGHIVTDLKYVKV